MNAKRWITLFFIAQPLIAAAVTGFNYTIDPYDVFHTPRIAQFNERKFTNQDRLANSLRLRRDPFHTVVLGTSRAQVGIDPADPTFGGQNVFNAAVSDSNVMEIARIGRYVLDHNPELRRIVYGLDLLTFSDKRTPDHRFDQSLYNPDTNPAKAHLDILFSRTTLNDSIDTVRGNLSNKNNNYWHNGFLYKGNSRINHRRMFDRVLKNNFLITRETYGCFAYDPHRFETFKNLVTAAADKGVTVKLFVSPVHARQLVALDMLGHTETYLQWLRALTAFTHQLATQTGADLELWDFSGFNHVTTEAIPEAPTQMRYYWESSHYTTEAGTLVLRTMNTGTPAATGFGVKLTPDNIDAHIEAFKTGKTRYQRDYPQEIKEVQALVQATQELRRKTCPD